MFASTLSTPSFSGRQSLDIATGPSHSLKQINQYLLICELGEGSFAKVYLGLNVENQKYYAVKRIHLNGLSRTISGISQLECEIRIMRNMHHSNIISLIEVIHVPSRSMVYIVLEYADCGNISSILQAGFKFTPVEIQSIFRQIADGVSFLHEKGVVHQDLKPSNILMKSDGTTLISDFGIGHSFQCAAMVVGTPAYQAPEVIDEFCDQDIDNTDPGKEDVWSLGVTLYELVFHELPFAGGNVFEIVRSIAMTEVLEPPTRCDPTLWELICRMLTVDPTKRINMKGIMDHPYVAEAPQKIEIKLKSFSPPLVDAKEDVIKLKGKVCGVNYSFANSDVSIQTKLKSYSAPFRSPFG